MSAQRTKSNKKFMILSAIGIFMVVDSHTFIPYFDVESFRRSEWYYWEIGNNAKILYAL